MSDRRQGRTPRTGAEWVRDTQRRLGRVENSETVRVGSWVLSEIDGELWATRPGRSVNLTPALSNGIAADPKERLTRYLTVTATGGTWLLSYRNIDTVLPWNVSAASFKAALVANYPDFTALDFDVVLTDGVYKVTFPGGTLYADPANLTGTDVGVSITATP